MRKVYIDESGNTGEDLLNVDQPHLVVSSHNFTTEEITQLLESFGSSEELHFKQLRNSKAGRQALINLFNDPLLTDSRVKSFVAHKKYAATGQLVDRVIEPVFYSKGIDLYRNGQNILMANALYWLGISDWRNGIMDGLLAKFISMIRSGSSQSRDEFYSFAQSIVPSDDMQTFFLDAILQSRSEIDQYLSETEKFEIDLIPSAFNVLCSQWYDVLGEKIIIEMDDSKQIEYHHELIEELINLDIEVQKVGFGDRTVTYPMQIEKLDLVPSKENRGVQLADLIASGYGFRLNNSNQKHQPFVDEISESRLLKEVKIHPIVPNTAVKPADLNMQDVEGNNILDFLVDLKQKSV